MHADDRNRVLPKPEDPASQACPIGPAPRLSPDDDWATTSWNSASAIDIAAAERAAADLLCALGVDLQQQLQCRSVAVVLTT